MTVQWELVQVCPAPRSTGYGSCCPKPIQHALLPPVRPTDEYLVAERRRHWWPQTGPLAHLASAVRRVAGACWRGAGGEDRLLRRVRDLESGSCAWMARPSIPGRRWRRMASAAAPPPLRGGTDFSLVAGLRAAGGGGLEAQQQQQQQPEETAADGGRLDGAAEQQAPLADSAHDKSSGGAASLASWGAVSRSAAPAAAAAAPEAPDEQVHGDAGTGTPLLLHPSPFDLSVSGVGATAPPPAPGGAPPAPAAAAPARASASLRPNFMAAPGAGPGGSHQSSLSAASGTRLTGGSAGGYSGTLGMPSRLGQPADEEALLGNSGSQRMFLPWQMAGLQAQAAAAATAAPQPAGDLLPQWQTVSDRASISVLPSLSGPAELWAGTEPPSFVGQHEEEQEAELPRSRRFSLAGVCGTACASVAGA